MRVVFAAIRAMMIREPTMAATVPRPAPLSISSSELLSFVVTSHCIQLQNDYLTAPAANVSGSKSAKKSLVDPLR
jgi:hypothetical protein